MKRSILISTSHFGSINAEAFSKLENAGFEITLNPYNRILSIPESIKLLQGKSALIASTEKLNEEVFSKCDELKYICRFGTGMDSVDLVAAQKYGITVENLPDVHVNSVAELTLGGILSALRRLPSSDNSVRTSAWKKYMGNLLKGKKIGLIGLGKVSKALIPLLQPFKVEIIVNDIYPDRDFALTYGVDLVDLNRLCKESQVLSLHTPYTKENHHLLSKNEMESFRKDIVIINTSRGGLIDETTLYSFLRANPQAFAYLDTMAAEPYDGPLISLENVFFSPHIGTFTGETRLQMELESVNKTIQFFKVNA